MDYTITEDRSPDRQMWVRTSGGRDSNGDSVALRSCVCFRWVGMSLELSIFSRRRGRAVENDEPEDAFITIDCYRCDRKGKLGNRCLLERRVRGVRGALAPVRPRRRILSDQNHSHLTL